MAAKIEAARPFKIAKAIFSMILETGQALTRIPNGKLLTSLLRDHGNPVFESLLDSRHIGQVSKISGGNVCVMVRPTVACKQLECQSVTVLGEKYFFKEYGTLERRYYMNVSGVGLEVER